MDSLFLILEYQNFVLSLVMLNSRTQTNGVKFFTKESLKTLYKCSSYYVGIFGKWFRVVGDWIPVKTGYVWGRGKVGKYKRTTFRICHIETI